MTKSFHVIQKFFTPLAKIGTFDYLYKWYFKHSIFHEINL